MHKSIIKLGCIVFFAGGSQVSFLEKVRPDSVSVSVTYHQGKHSDVKLALIDQKWIQYVFLEDDMPELHASCISKLSITVRLNVLSYLLELVENFDSIATICAFPWFEDPDLMLLVCSQEELELFTSLIVLL